MAEVARVVLEGQTFERREGRWGIVDADSARWHVIQFAIAHPLLQEVLRLTDLVEALETRITHANDRATARERGLYGQCTDAVEDAEADAVQLFASEDHAH